MVVEELLASLDNVGGSVLRKALRNNGGGLYNHNLYFATIGPNAKHAPEGKLAEKIDATFGDFDVLKAKLTEFAV